MTDAIFEKFKEVFPSIEQNIPLNQYTNFKIGGSAKYFLIAKETEGLVKAVALAKELGVRIFILGGGTNLLVADEGFNGLVIKMEFTDWKLVSDTTIEAGTGVMMKDLVSASINEGLAGLEWAGGLPGTFGGAIRGNAGAFGGEMKDSIIEVLALDEHLELKKLDNQESGFSYRNSLFKEKKWPILSATMQLKKGNKEELQAIADSRINYRKEKHPLEFPNAGSVFKNVDFKSLAPQFQEEFRDKMKQDPFPIIPTAWFIIGAGLTGVKMGQAQISDKHSNYIVNLGGATAQDVLALIDLVKKTIKEKYGVELEQEIEYLK